MEKNKKNYIKEDKKKDDGNDYNSITFFISYLDRMTELLNRNIIDYSSKYKIITIIYY